MFRLSALAAASASLALAACSPGETPSDPTGAATTVVETETDISTPTPDPTATAPIASGEPTPTASPTDDATDACGALKVRGRWLNAMHTADVAAQIAATVGQRRIRTYTDGDPITMDYSEERLNVVLGKDGRIKEFRCG